MSQRSCDLNSDIVCHEYWDDVFHKLTQDGTPFDFSNFMSLNNNAERTRDVYKWFKDNDLLPGRDLYKSEKCEETSLDARKKGNELFAEKNYISAMEMYNKSLCFAPLSSEHLAISYANRSAVYFECELFNYCLQNIELALNNNYPDRLKDKLLKRKEDCLEFLKTKKDGIEIHFNSRTKIPPLTYAANPKIPFVIASLKMNRNNECGRGIFTEIDLKPGDIVLTEKSFISTYYERDVNNLYMFCGNCGKNNDFNLIPCPKSATTMFCPDKCADEAWNKFYKFEYPITDMIYHLYGDLNCTVGLRAAVRTFALFDNPADVKEFIDSIDPEKENVFDVDFNIADDCAKFKIFYSLNTNQERRKRLDLIKRICICAVAWHIFKEFTPMGELLNDPEHEDFFLELLARCNQISSVNNFGRQFSLRKDQPYRQCGSCVMLVSSFFNHSCAPNVSRINLNGTMVVMVTRPIKAGNQVLCSYGPEHLEYTLTQRQDYFRKSGYHFVCNCEACTNDYPMMEEIPNKNIPNSVLMTAQLMNSKLDVDHSNGKYLETYEKEAALISKFLNESDHLYPSIRLEYLRSSIKKRQEIFIYRQPLESIFRGKK